VFYRKYEIKTEFFIIVADAQHNQAIDIKIIIKAFARAEFQSQPQQNTTLSCWLQDQLCMLYALETTARNSAYRHT